MTSNIDEAVSILGMMTTALRGTLVTAAGLPAADLYYALGDLVANAGTMLQAGQIGSPMLNCFDLAVSAGATIATMEQVRLAMMAGTPVSVIAIAVTIGAIRMALAEEVKIYAATTFTSRQDVDAALSQLNDAFDGAVDYAADNQDPMAYQALIAAHAAVVKDLTTRARPLPNMVTYSFGRVMTSHTLANRLYGDANRCDELRLENKVIAPAFMPISGSALSQ